VNNNAARQHRQTAEKEVLNPDFRSRSQYDLQLVETYKAKYEVKSMKLKKVTALLLATSMVLTSVNVAPIFADEEIIFGEELSVEDDASADADFGDVVVEDGAAEEENTSADVAFDDVIEDDTVAEEETYADEVVEDSYVEEEVVAEDEALEEGAIPEEFEDVYAALESASEDAGYADEMTPAQLADTYVYFGEKTDANAVVGTTAVTRTFEILWNSTAWTPGDLIHIKYDGTSVVDADLQFDDSVAEDGFTHTTTVTVPVGAGVAATLKIKWKVVPLLKDAEGKPALTVSRVYDGTSYGGVTWPTADVYFAGKMTDASGTETEIPAWRKLNTIFTADNLKNVCKIEGRAAVANTGDTNPVNILFETVPAEVTVASKKDAEITYGELVGTVPYTVTATNGTSEQKAAIETAAKTDLGTKVTFLVTDGKTSYDLAENPNTILHKGAYTLTPKESDEIKALTNFKFKLEEGNLTVKAKDATVKWGIKGTDGAATIAYDPDTTQSVEIQSVKIDGIESKDKFEFALSGVTEQKNVGTNLVATATVKTYKTSNTPEAQDGDFNFVNAEGKDGLSFTWKITAEKATVTIAEAQVTYGTDPSKIKVYRRVGSRYYENTYTGKSKDDKEVAAAALDENRVVYTLSPDNATTGAVSLDFKAYTSKSQVKDSPIANAAHLNTDKLKMDDYELPAVTSVDLTVKPLVLGNNDIIWGVPDIFTYDGKTTHKYVGVTLVKTLNNDAVTVNYTPASSFEEKERGDYTVEILSLGPTSKDATGYKNYDLSGLTTAKTHVWHVLDGLSKTVTFNGDWQTIDVPEGMFYAIEFLDPASGEWKTTPPKFIDAKYNDAAYDKAEPVEDYQLDSYAIQYRYMSSKTATTWTDKDANGNNLYAYLTILPATIKASWGNTSYVYGTDFDNVILPYAVGNWQANNFTYDKFLGSDTESGIQYAWHWDPSTSVFWNYAGEAFTYPEFQIWQWDGISKFIKYTGDSVLPVGRYKISFGKNNKKILTHVNVNYKQNYIVELVDTEFTVTQKALHVDWAKDLEYNGQQQTYPAPVIIDNKGEKASGYTVTIEGNYGKNVDSYTATITKITFGGKDVTDDVKIADAEKTHTWKIAPMKVKVVASLNEDVIRYGDPDPTTTWNMTDLKVFKWDATKDEMKVPANELSKKEFTNTPTFKTTYRQWSNATLKKGWKETDKTTTNGYKVEVSGLESTNYQVMNWVPDYLYVEPAEVYVKPTDVVVGADATPVVVTEYGFANYDPVNGPNDTVAAKHDNDDKLFTVKLQTVPTTPRAVGVYPIQSSVTYGSSYIRKDGTQNVIVHTTLGAGETSADSKKATGTYNVIKGDITVKISSVTTEYDGKYHSITVTPATLPNGITIYFSETNYLGKETTGTDAEKQAAAKKKFIAEGLTTNPAYYKVGTYTVYYYVTGGTTYEVDFLGNATVTIKDNNEAKASDIEKLIDAALKKDASGKYDADKVKAARDAYEAASKAAKDLVDKIKLKDLEAAEKEIADEAAKQIAALLPADPSKAVDTDRPNYEQAKGIYDALTEAEKAYIPDTKKALDTAKAAIEADEAAKEKPFTDAVAALPKAADAKASDRAAVDAAKAIYDGLTAKEKEDVAAVKAVLDGIDAAVAAAEKAEGDADKKAAEAVTAMINALPAPEDVTVADENAIKNAVDAFDALTEAQEALVPDVAKEKLAADVLALAAAMVKEAEDQAAADEIEALIDAIAKSEPGDGKAAMEAAKDAFNNATDDVKAKVDKGHQEILDDAIECYKKDTTFNAGRGVYRVLSNGDVTYVKPLYPEDTYFEVPNDVVCPEGFPFKVVKISVNAFKGCTNVTKVWMGKNIVTIGKYAFKGATNLRTLIIRTQAIDVTEKIENAFAGVAANRNGKVNVQIWEKMLTKYEPMFRGAGRLPEKAYFTTID
jgi:hypothetical protein